ncbi:hypothetical protein FEM48_Zijuj12G0036400 [Ziziphus jujuba var. spinosa]|uniref:ribonuclease P n=1 Tax=Ziziphus jujuba var. spinosa TaxID=714518 RepID=A0A978UAZ1_ZIZJJ|nr:hypothetical protein FEM48_Zijuj12G0036400 [Ziziphus jujuba var. spinosa]
MNSFQRPHMASFSFNSLQQNHHLFSVTLCKYPSTLIGLKSHYSSCFFTSSPSKHTLELAPLLVVKGNVSNTITKSSTTDHNPSTETKNSKTRKETGPGFPTLRSIEKKVGKKFVKKYGSSVVEEKTENGFTKDRNLRKNLGFRKRREMSNGHSSIKSKDKNTGVVKSLESTKIVNHKKDVKAKEGINKQVGGEDKKEKGSKKNKVDSPEVQMRIGLDMCSKRGDVMGAIQFYDLAQREGIKMGQYHYTVLLYLCSSAAVGVVQPAKSGSGTRTLNALESPSEVSMVNSTDLSKSSHLDNWGDRELNVSVSDNGYLNGSGRVHRTADNVELNSATCIDDHDSSFNEKEKLAWFSNGFVKRNSRLLDGLSNPNKCDDDSSHVEDGSKNQENERILVDEDVKKYALEKGFEIYEKMCLEKIPMNEAALTSVARMAMSMGNGDMAFDMVKQMKSLGINPRLRSYGPALSAFCNSGNVDKAFAVEKHMLENGVYPEEPELEALLRVSVGVGKGDRVYYLLHKLRTHVRKVSLSTANLIASWFESKAASRVGKTKWDQGLIKEAIENGGGGWHGQGWLGRGKWSVLLTTIGVDGLCKCCGEKLATIDLDPKETEDFAESVASIAIKREKNSSFQKFQINAVVNAIRQKLPSKKWPLIVLHNKRITGRRMDEPINRALVDKWRNADALYATPTGSNDDWYWLYAAIKFKCLIVTNDEMRDHTFQLLGNDFFPKWKERHQVHFSFTDAGPVFHMPPPCSVVIQESEKGHWHIPILSEHDYEAERPWLCITRAKSRVTRQKSETGDEDLQLLHHSKGFVRPATKTEASQPLINYKHENQETYKSLRDILSESMILDNHSILSDIETAEMLGGCTIDFQI